MLPPLIERLRQVQGRGYAPCATIIAKAGRSMKSDGFSKAFAKARKHSEMAGVIDGLLFKDLRNTTVTNMGNGGATAIEIAAITGHTLASVNTILRSYLVHTTHQAQSAMAKMHAFLEG